METFITKNFKVEEFFKDDVKADIKKLDINFINELQQARNIASHLRCKDVKFVITSGVRTNSLNHMSGKAADISCKDSRTRFYIIKALLYQGFNRIGIYDRHIHVDNVKKEDQDVMWWGKSE